MSDAAERIPAAMIPSALTWANLFRPSPDPALLAAEEEIRDLRAALAERDADAALLDRVWTGPVLSPLVRWPPGWLVEMVEAGRADALQVDRALVAKPTPNIYGATTAPIPLLPAAPWFRHAETPHGFDAAMYASACRVLARCSGAESHPTGTTASATTRAKHAGSR